MTARILDGRRIAENLLDELKAKVDARVAAGQPMEKDEARERIYGMPFAEWKARFQKEATPEQLAAFASAQRGHD